MSEHLNDEAVEALLSGHERDQPLGALLASIADHYGTIDPAAPGPELAALISTGLTDGAAVVDLAGARRRRKGAIIAAVTGTVVGKVLIGVSVAAASVAGMQASGIVDVPMLPDAHHRVVVDRPEPTTTTQPTTSTSVPPPVVTTLPVAPLDDSSDEPAAKAAPLVANTPPPRPVDPAGQHDQDHHDAVVDSTVGETVGDNGSHGGSSDDDHSGNDERSDERLSERNDAAPSEKRTIESTVPRPGRDNTDATPDGADDHNRGD
jgi:hypothetical protein